MCQTVRFFGLRLCQYNVFCLAQRRGLSQEAEPNLSWDMKTRNPRQQVESERSDARMVRYSRSRVVSA